MSKIIQIGIDLGTTNSAIAINKDGKIEIIKNLDRDEYTPSVFGFDKAGNSLVGKRAYNKLFKEANDEDIENFKAEVKRLMGTSEIKYFPRVKKNFTAEEISAELVKYLKESVLKQYPNFDITGVVITIPAHFSTLQSEATKRAGELAGFKHVILVQEPIAAAMAYGYAKEKNATWLVYDLGGGTFDVAILQSQDGYLNVIGHKGDNFLGGKDIDELIIDKIFVPEITKKFELYGFDRKNEKFKSIFNRLKGLAEEAKKYLSQEEIYIVEIDKIGKDDNGEEIYLNLEITRNQFEILITPFIEKTIKITEDAIKEAGIKKGSISKIILVGGPTQIPYVRSQLKERTGIEVDGSADPLTIVANGACIFGASQIIPENLIVSDKKVPKNAVKVDINYSPISSESEETVTGIIQDFSDGKDKYYIQIQSESGYYTSNKIEIKKGKFIAEVQIEKGKSNLFWIYIFDEDGKTIPIVNDSFTITDGVDVGGIPIPNSIGVSIVKKNHENDFKLEEKMDFYFMRNDKLPLTKTVTYKTIKAIKKGDNANTLPIKVYEGESEMPDRNTFICDVALNGKHVPYDLPQGTEIEVTLAIDESRTLKVEAYIPQIDLKLSVRSTEHDEKISVGNLQNSLTTEKKRYEKIKNLLTSDEKEHLDKTIAELEHSMDNLGYDEDSKRKSNHELKNFKSEIDKVEKTKEFSLLLDKFTHQTKVLNDFFAGENINTEGIDELKRHFLSMEQQGKAAIEKKDKDILKHMCEQLEGLIYSILAKDPVRWENLYNDLASGRYVFADKNQANTLLEQGKNAIDKHNFEELKISVRGLMDILSRDDQGMLLSKSMSGITR